MTVPDEWLGEETIAMTEPAQVEEPQDDIPFPYSEGFIAEVITKNGSEFRSYLGKDEGNAIAWINNLSGWMHRHTGADLHSKGTRSQPIYFRDR